MGEALPGVRRGAARLDARVALLCAAGFVVCEVATPIEQWPRFAAYALLAAVGVLACGLPPGWLVKRTALVAPFVVAVGISVAVTRPGEGDALALPLVKAVVSRRAMLLLASVGVKGVLSVTAVSMLIGVIGFQRVLRALQSLRVPRLFVTLLSFMWRYIGVLADAAMRMMRARDSRGRPPELRRRARVAGHMAGSLFLRSFERAERVGQAMVARGYDGTVRLLVSAERVRGADALLLGGLAAALVSIILLMPEV
ncbi:MAG: cobalt ECF transporter T component CbiQ [Gemmatimonadales bacterium]|jgi:cobalt/nickel transport system permease protein